MFPKINPVETQAWKSLCEQYEKVKNHPICMLFNEDQSRFNNFSIQLNDLLFDYSKNNISLQTKQNLINLANECQLGNAIEAMFCGEKINETEGRAVLHTALRSKENEILADGRNVIPAIKKVKDQMQSFCDKLHSGAWKGFDGKPITDIVNIGIGGSDLGPVMVTEALRPYWKNIKPHFVSNVDSAHLVRVLEKVDPSTTLFLIASKTFTTRETMTNAFSARKWFLEKGGTESSIPNHFVAISTNEKEVKRFGIPAENMFEFWDWVGGRYSLWSAIGLSIAITIGFKNYEELLDGANNIDVHFRNTPFEKNIPVMMALVGIWNRNFCNYSTESILPYNQYLHRFAAYFQQGNMESNGKSVDRNDKFISYQTGPVIWGEPGTNGQHAFFQLLHQGTQVVPCDFIACAVSNDPLGDHHKILLSNFFAQTEALMNGEVNANPHRNFSGNRPTNSILLKQLTPYSLGQLIAMYEHKIFVQGVIWNIYSFDQFGVELGKVLANNILPQLEGDELIASHDGSTNGLINFYKRLRK